MNKIIFFQLLGKKNQFSRVLIFFLILGCNSEFTPHQDEVSKINANDSKDLQLKDTVIPVTKETRQLYQQYCAQCHGIKGHGDGVNAPYLVVPPRDHTKSHYLETRSDAQLFDAIKLGGLAVGRAPCMPAWGHTFGDETIGFLVNYIRELCDCKAL